MHGNCDHGTRTFAPLHSIYYWPNNSRSSTVSVDGCWMRARHYYFHPHTRFLVLLAFARLPELFFPRPTVPSLRTILQLQGGNTLLGKVDAFPIAIQFSSRRHHQSISRRRVSNSDDNDDSDATKSRILPPTAARDESGVVLLGKDSFLMSAGDPASLENDEWLDPVVAVPDPYCWMKVMTKEQDSEQQQRVRDHIDAENNYTEHFFQYDDNHGGRRKRLHQSLLREYLALHDENTNTSQAKEEDKVEISQLYFSNGFYFYRKRLLSAAASTAASKPYPLHCRVQASYTVEKHVPILPLGMAQKEQVILDENVIATLLRKEEGDDDCSRQNFFAIHSVVPIPKRDTNTTSSSLGGAVAFSVDLVGDESYTIFILLDSSSTDGNNVESRLVKVAENTSGTIEYVPTIIRDGADDNHDSLPYYSLHFIQLDLVLHRPFQWVQWQPACNNGSHNSKKDILYTEPDKRYWGDLTRTSDGQHLLWKSKSSGTVLGAIFALNVTNPPRKDNLVSIQVPAALSRFELDHRKGHWWILNLNESAASAEQLYTSSHADASILLPVHHRALPATCALNHLVTFADHVVVQGRQDGLQCIWVLTEDTSSTSTGNENQSWSAQQLFDSPKETEAYYVALARKQDFNSNLCILTYESMVTPPQIIQVNLMDKATITLYEQAIPGYAKEEMCCRRLEVPSRDGKVSIPVSLVFHKNLTFPRPLHLLGYGAYGHSLEPSFSTIRLPLLNRGVICAVAHVRGGGERGLYWYASGKGEFKQNSIDDFCDVAKWLVDHNWTKPECLAAEGRSAGGLLVASAMNQNPDLFRSVVLGVPFLDILCTMADSTLPLTAQEWDEWGNPHTKKGFNIIRGYAPMHNIAPSKAYPSCLMIAGWKDPRVPYWESLKFAAALRHSTLAERPILVKIDHHAGHSFGSNRTKYFEELAWIYTLVLDQISINNTVTSS